MPSILLKPGWVFTHLAVIATAVLFISLGLWQLERRTETTDANDRIAEVIDGEPVPLTDTLLRDPIEYQPVTVSGTYLPDSDVSLSPRSRNGRPGYEVLTPFVTDAGDTIVVNRGWVPLEASAPPPPVGPAAVDARLQEPRASRRVITADDGTVQTLGAVDLDRLGTQVDRLVTTTYAEVVDEEARQAGVIPRPADPPSLDSGNHLSYALQWFAFTLIGLIGYPLLLRRRMADARERAPAERSGAAEAAAAS